MKKIVLSLLILIILACFPPYKPIWFKSDDKWAEILILTRDNLSVTIKGIYAPIPSFEDEILVKIEIKPRREIYPKDIIITSNRFSFDTLYHSYAQQEIYYLHLKDRNGIDFRMSPSEYAKYLDSRYLKITLLNLFNEPFSFEVNYERQWQKEQFIGVQKYRAEHK